MFKEWKGRKKKGIKEREESKEKKKTNRKKKKEKRKKKDISTKLYYFNPKICTLPIRYLVPLFLLFPISS